MFVRFSPAIRFQRCTLGCILTCCGWAFGAHAAGRQVHAQFGRVAPVEISVDVELDEVDSAARARLQRVSAFVSDGQWGEAVESLRQVMETDSDRVIPWDLPGNQADVDFQRFVTLRDYGHRLLCSFARKAPPALELYRRRVDPLAARWFEEGLRNRDERMLLRVTGELFASSYGDDALYALGEIYLQQGAYTRARGCWERISPTLRAPSGLPFAYALRGQSVDEHWPEIAPWVASRDAEPSWLAYPDTDLDLAAVRARLVLVSLLEGSLERADLELRLLTRIAPQASGRIAGRDARFVSTLEELLAAARQWPAQVAPPGTWPTFAGSYHRDGQALSGVDVLPNPIWSIPLGDAQRAGDSIGAMFGFGGRRVAERGTAVLACFPVFSGGRVILNDHRYIRSFDLSSGRPAFPVANVDAESPLYGAVYRPRSNRLDVSANEAVRLGASRFTLTLHDNLLFARMGSPITGRPLGEQPVVESGYVVGLDMRAQGKQLPGFPLRPDDDGWQFEGAPVTDGVRLFIGMRRSGVRSQAYVACYDILSGRRCWRRKISAAETQAHGQVEEITSNLLTLSEGTLYYNTNLGVVAALDEFDGDVKWITRYPRTGPGGLASGAIHHFRDLNPCLSWRGIVFVAPADFRGMFALDANTGQVIWENSHAGDAVHLLGVGHGNLIASGSQLSWFDAHTGQLRNRQPATGSNRLGHAGPEPSGYGRGVLVEDHVYWPTHDAIFIFDQALKSSSTEEEVPGGLVQQSESRLDRVIRFPKDSTGHRLTGGNLFVVDGHLIIATADRLLVFNAFGRVLADRGAERG